MKAKNIKMLRLITVILFVIIAFTGCSVKENLFDHIPDIKFREYCLRFDTNGDKKLSKKEAAAVTKIKLAKHWEVSSLEGIEYFVNLTYLDCSRNQLSELYLSSNTALDSLYCTDNPLSVLDVKECKLLTVLYCDQTNLPMLDVSHYKKLKVLDCSYTTSLSSLNVNGCTKLSSLDCFLCGLSTLDVSSCENLSWLICPYNQLSSLNVNGCEKLRELQCYDNQLTHLNVSSNKLLEILRCEKNRIASLNLFENELIEELDCSENRITILDVSKNTSLNLLWLDDNDIRKVIVWQEFDVINPQKAFSNLNYDADVIFVKASL